MSWPLHSLLFRFFSASRARTNSLPIISRMHAVVRWSPSSLFSSFFVLANCPCVATGINILMVQHQSFLTHIFKILKHIKQLCGLTLFIQLPTIVRLNKAFIYKNDNSFATPSVQAHQHCSECPLLQVLQLSHVQLISIVVNAPSIKFSNCRKSTDDLQITIS